MNNKKVLISISILLISFLNHAYSQCCSMGSPAGASTYVGVLAKNHLRFIPFYRYNYLDTYYEGSSVSELPTLLKKSFYNYTGLTISYGITKRLTVDADIGYFINKTQVYDVEGDNTVTGYGLSNGSIVFKYGAYIKPLKQIELTFGAGLKYPFTLEPLYVDGTRLPIDLQPSSNAFGLSGHLIFSKGFSKIGLRLMSVNKYEYNFENQDNYQYGSSLSNSVIISKKIVKNLFGVLQLRNEFKSYDHANNGKEINTGGDVLILSAQMSYSLLCKWHIAGLFDFPLYKFFNGRQLAPKYSFALSLTRDLDLNRKNKK